MNTRLRKSITFTSVNRASPPDAVYMIPPHRDPAYPIHRSRLTGLARCSYKRSLIEQRILLFTQISPRRASPVRRAIPSHINRMHCSQERALLSATHDIVLYVQLQHNESHLLPRIEFNCETGLLWIGT